MLEFHPLAEIFPLLEGAPFDELVEDIRDNGLREPIVLDNLLICDGRILDGRNRYRACEAAGVNCRFTVIDSGVDPLAYVISKNLHRRHLTESQRAMVAAKLATLRPGRPAATAPHPGPLPAGGEREQEAAEEKPANLPDFRQAQASELLNVSERSVRHARGVVEHGVPGLARAVERGDVKVSLAAAIATLAPVEQEAVLVKVGSPEFAAEVRRLRAEKTEAKKRSRDAREADLGRRQRALPEQKFGVILADPEWQFETWSEAGMDRAAANHYPTSPVEIIMARPVAGLAADDAALFLWVPGPHLEAGLVVMKAWGFAYKAQWAWVKQGAPGTGYWNRGDHELLLLGTRGKVPCPAQGQNWSSVFDARKGRHSEKPDAAYELIEDYFPSLPKIELNARGSRFGWVAWGLEAPPATPEAAGAEPSPSPSPSPRGGGVQSGGPSPLPSPRPALSARGEGDEVAA